MEELINISPAATEAPNVLAPSRIQMWEAARRALADRLPAGDYKTWIEPLKLYSAENGRVILTGPNPFFLNWVKNHYLSDLATALAASGFEARSPLEFITELDQDQGELTTTDDAARDYDADRPAEQRVMPSPACLSGFSSPRLSGRFTFDSFVVGDSNLYAYSAAKAMAAGAALGSDALFITSDHGLGKSHLSMAMGRAFLENKPGRQIYYLTAEDFTNEMTHALRHGTMEDFKSKYRRNCDVLVLEEVQFLAGKEKIQSELCFTLDCLMERGKKVVFTSPQEPKGIPRLGRSFRSRLSTALVSPIGAPEYETRLTILMKKAKSIDFKISRSVLEYVAERVTSDVRQLESCLISLRAKSQLLSRQVDLDMAREALAYLFDDQLEGALTPIAVRALICRHFHLEVADITSRDRSTKITEARTLGMYLSRQLTGRTLEEIGRIFGRTHSSALYAINKLEQRLKKDAKLQGKVEFFSQKLVSGNL